MGLRGKSRRQRNQLLGIAAAVARHRKRVLTDDSVPVTNDRLERAKEHAKRIKEKRERRGEWKYKARKKTTKAQAAKAGQKGGKGKKGKQASE